MSVPRQLQHHKFRFIKLGHQRKIPIEKGWQTTANYQYNHPTLCLHQRRKVNYGVATGYGNLLVVDFDDADAQAKALPQLPETFGVISGGRGFNVCIIQPIHYRYERYINHITTGYDMIRKHPIVGVVTNKECLRCGHNWMPRITTEPIICPNCSSPYWNTPRKKEDTTNDAT